MATRHSLTTEVDRLRTVILEAFKSENPKTVLARELFGDERYTRETTPLAVADADLWAAYSSLYGFDNDPNRLPLRLIQDILARGERALAARGLALRTDGEIHGRNS